MTLADGSQCRCFNLTRVHLKQLEGRARPVLPWWKFHACRCGRQSIVLYFDVVCLSEARKTRLAGEHILDNGQAVQY